MKKPDPVEIAGLIVLFLAIAWILMGLPL